MLQQFIDVNNMFWEGSAFQWAFYISVVLILIFEKDKTKKMVFGVFPIVVFVIIFNPVMPAVLSKFINSVNLYYVRFFSVIPVFYCIAHGAILLLNKLKVASKMILVGGVAAFIVFAGHSVIQETWLSKAANFEKIPEDAAAVLSAIPREKENISVAFPSPLNIYARQIDASIKMPYGRSWSRPIVLFDELNKKVPDAAVVMGNAGSQSVDYVVVNKNDEVRKAFSDAGHEAVDETDKYLIYSVSGVKHTEREYNEKNQVMSVTTCDAEGNMISNSVGYAKTVYEYDSKGNRVKETYFDRHGDVFEVEDGYASILREYRSSGVRESQKYLDADGQSVLVDGRYETEFGYNSDRRIIQERYFDQQGQRMNRTDTNYAVKDIKYDENGNIVAEKYSDVNGNLTLSSDGYAGFKKEFDENNNLTFEAYFGDDGKPMAMDDGCAGFRRVYDTSGNVISETYLDANGELTARNGQYAVLKRKYDENQNLIEESYWDKNGNPYQLAEGYCVFTRLYDENGDIVEEQLRDAEGKETIINDQRIVSFATNGILKDGAFYSPTNDQYTFITSLEDNRFNQVNIQLWDMNMTEFIQTVASASESGICNEKYIHDEKTGWYKVRLKGNTNLHDVAVDFEAFLQNGKEYDYSFNVVSIEEKKVCVSGFSFSGPGPWIMEQKLITEETDRT